MIFLIFKVFLRPHVSAEPAAGTLERGRQRVGIKGTAFSQSSSVWFSFKVSGQDLVWISGFCAEFSENRPPKGIVSALIQSEFLCAPYIAFLSCHLCWDSHFLHRVFTTKQLVFTWAIVQRKAFKYHIFWLIFIVF